MSSPRSVGVARRYGDPAFRARHKAATRAALAIEWRDDMDARLADLYLGGASWAEIERRMGYTHTTCLKRVRELGIYRQRKPGPARGSKRKPPKITRACE